MGGAHFGILGRIALKHAIGGLRKCGSAGNWKNRSATNWHALSYLPLAHSPPQTAKNGGRNVGGVGKAREKLSGVAVAFVSWSAPSGAAI